jgi:hypothetical protein
MKACLILILLAWPLVSGAEEPAAAAGLTNTVSGDEIPAPPEGAKDTSGDAAAAPLPKAEEPVKIPEKPFVWKAKTKGFPFLEVGLSALGGGIMGAFVGFVSSGKSNGEIDYSQMGKNIAIFGGIGFAAGAVLGYTFSLLDPVLLHPPEPTAGLNLALLPGGTGLSFSTNW